MEMRTRKAQLYSLARRVTAVLLVVCFCVVQRPTLVLAQQGAANQRQDGKEEGPDVETQSPDHRETAFRPINLSDQNFPLLFQSFENITLDEFNLKKVADNGTVKQLEETRRTVLQGVNVTELYLYKGDFNVNNSLLVFQVKLIQPKMDQQEEASKFAQSQTISAILSSAYLDEAYPGQAMPDQRVVFKKQTSADQDVDQKAMDDAADVYLAHFALTPCQYLRFMQVSAADKLPPLKQFNSSIFEKHKIIQRKMDRQGNQVAHETLYRYQLLNLNIKIEQITKQMIAEINETSGNQSAAAKPGQAQIDQSSKKFNFQTSIYAIQQNKIRNYMCQTDQGLQNILNYNALYNSSENVVGGEVFFHLDNKISNQLNPVFSSFEYTPNQNSFYAIGSGHLNSSSVAQGSKAQQIQSLQKLHKPSFFKFDFVENSWIQIIKQSDVILNTGQKVYKSLWPKFQFGESVAQYFGYLVLFGSQPVDDANGHQPRQQLWIYDTFIEDWFLVEPEDTPLDKQAWPSSFQSRVLMGASPILNNGLILYIGGYQQEQNDTSAAATAQSDGVQITNTTKRHAGKNAYASASPTSAQAQASQILMLNIEFIIEKIVSLKNQQSARRSLRLPSQEIWSDMLLGTDGDQEMEKLDLNGHSVLQLPELNSVLILGGRQNNERMTDNAKMFILNIQNKTLQTLEPWTAFQAILPVRMSAQLSIDNTFSFEKSSDQFIRVSIQSGYNQQTGEVYHDHWIMDIDLESMKYKLKLNQAASLSPIIVPAYSQMISYTTYDNEDGAKKSEPLALIQQNQDLNFVVLVEDQCSEILLGEYTNVDMAAQQKYIACQNTVRENTKIANSQRKCPSGYVEQHSKGLNYCTICGENKFFNFTSGTCQQCLKSMACFLGSLQPLVNLKQELNKFNVSNNPSLYDTGPLRKQMIQESYFGHASMLFFSAFILAFVLIHMPKYQRHVIRLIVNSDFLMISGGEHKTFIGGLITIIYIVGNFFVILSLLQTKINLNEWIDSTQMAPQTSDLKVNNDLYVEMHFYMNQVSLDKPNYAKGKLKDNHYTNLCDLGVFRMQKQEELNTKRGRYKHSGYGPKKIFTNIKETNCTRLPLSSQSIKHNTGEMVYNVQFLINDFILDDPRDTQVVKINIDNLVSIKGNDPHDASQLQLQNETVFLNYFSYQVQSIWNSINNIDENEVDGEDVEEKPLTLADVARNQVPRSNGHHIRTHLQKKYYEQRAINKKSIWERINPFAYVEDPETQRLRCVGCSKLSGKIASDDYQERTYSRNSQLEINVKATPVYYQNFLNYWSYQGYQLHYISMRYGETAPALAQVFEQEPLQLNARDLSIFQKTDGNFQRSGTIPFINNNVSALDGDVLSTAAQTSAQMPTDIPSSILTNILQQATSVAGQQVTDAPGSINPAENLVTAGQSQSQQQSSFVIDINFNLSENISQVRVSGRKSWLSMFAEILAFMAGLRFWATLLKYMMTINNIGRYYDRMHKIYAYEDEQIKRKQGKDHASLLTKEQKEASAMKQRYSSAYPGEDVLSAKTAHSLGSRFEAKFARNRKVKKNAGTSPIGSRHPSSNQILQDDVEQLDDDPPMFDKDAKIRTSRTFLNPSGMVFPLDEQKASKMHQEDIINVDEDMDDLRENYQWTPKNIMLPQDSKDGDFELHVQTLNDNDEVQQEQSYDSNLMPIESKFQKMVKHKKAKESRSFNVKYDQMDDDDARSSRSYGGVRDEETQPREIRNIEKVDRDQLRKYDYF